MAEADGPGAAPLALERDKTVDFGPLTDSLGFLLRLSQLASFRAFFAALGGLDIRPGEASVLLLIDRNPGIRQGVVANHLMIKRAHMAKMMRRMEADGLVTRAVPADDRRATEITLTAAGRARVAQLEGPFMAHEATSPGALTPREARELKRLLQKYLGFCPSREAPQ